MATKPDGTIETARLRLEPLALRHARGLEAFARLWEVARFTSQVPHPYPPGGATAFIEGVMAERRRGGGHVFAAVDKASGSVIGCAGLDLGDDGRSAELGYIYAPWVWGRGYATETARALVGHGFETLGLDAVLSHAMVANRASCRVLAKAGLRRIGNNVFEVPPERGSRAIGECYRLTRREWQA